MQRAYASAIPHPEDQLTALNLAVRCHVPCAPRRQRRFQHQRTELNLPRRWGRWIAKHPVETSSLVARRDEATNLASRPGQMQPGSLSSARSVATRSRATPTEPRLTGVEVDSASVNSRALPVLSSWRPRASRATTHRRGGSGGRSDFPSSLVPARVPMSEYPLVGNRPFRSFNSARDIEPQPLGEATWHG